MTASAFIAAITELEETPLASRTRDLVENVAASWAPQDAENRAAFVAQVLHLVTWSA